MEKELKTAASKNQKIYLSWIFDLLIYIVILNLFVEYNSNVYIDGFTLSIFVAIVFKILLFLIFELEHKVSHFFKSFESILGKSLNIISAFAILFLSKFVILEIIDFLFGKYVEINGLITIILIILTMIITRKVLEDIYYKL